MNDETLSAYQIRAKQKRDDPWRGRKVASVGTVIEVSRMAIGAGSYGLCARIEIESSNVPGPEPCTHVFWLPESMRKQQIAAPIEGTRIAFVHHLYLGVRRLRDFKLAPSVPSTPSPTPRPRINTQPPVSSDWDDF